MEYAILEATDYNLIEQAEEFLKQRYIEDKRFIVAAARMKNGQTIMAVNIRAYVGRASVCAESGLLQRIFDEKLECPELFVVFCYQKGIVTPCGMCRELLSDYCADSAIIISVGEHLKKCRVYDLLPHKFFGLPKNSFGQIS